MKKKLTKMIGIRMTEEMYRRLEKKADETGLRVADLGRWAFAQLLGEVEPDKIRKWHQAHELWETWWDYWGGIHYYIDKYQDAVCFFCGEIEGHDEKCVYPSVRELLLTN